MFPKESGKVNGLFKKCLAKLSAFPEKSRQGYRTFQKMSGKVAGLFLKKYVSGHAFPRLNVRGARPDFPKKAR
jgi:hypothetical protein